jgi:phosphoribosylaminoimidazole-succinocarboxamide synthase
VVRGYLSGSAWQEYRARGTLAGEALPPGLRESDALEPPLFSPATKAETGHDENIAVSVMAERLGEDAARALEALSRRVYEFGRDHARGRGIVVADTKFEFGLRDGRILLVDEVLTPDSSRFWPADRYAPGGPQPSFDKQPLRDWLAAERAAGRWDGDAPAPALPAEVVAATSRRYLAAFRQLTGGPLPGVPPDAS